jgi:uncharacterized protein YkwD
MAAGRRRVFFSAMTVPILRRSLLLLPLGLLLLLPAPCCGEAAPDREALVRGAFLRALNEERAHADAPPLRLIERLTEAAQEHAEELARRRSVDLEPGSEDRMKRRLERVGYLPHAWVESVASSNGGPAAVVADWRRLSRDAYRRVMTPEFRDVGIGVSRAGGVPVYTLLFAVPEGEFFSRGTAALSDLAAVRAAMLARVNRERRAAGVLSLDLNPQLDRAAQSHAVDMLRRSYFDHRGLDGSTTLDRVLAAGYPARSVGENIAEGQFTVDEVVDGWLASPGHRRNLLDKRFRELGLGLALGAARPGQPNRVIWVQNFGRRR